MTTINFAKISAGFEAAKNMQTEWRAEWRELTDFLLPARGVYVDTEPSKRKLYSSSIINSVGSDALGVLVAGLHGGLTSPALPWFRLEWAKADIQRFEPLKGWLQDCNDRMHAMLQHSNFYSVIASFYEEYSGFGTGCIYLGEDTYDETKAARWELLTAGEYAYTTDAIGRLNTFYRMLFMSPQQLYDLFGQAVSSELRRAVTENLPNRYEPNVQVLEFITRDKFMDKKVTRYLMEYNKNNADDEGNTRYLSKSGFYEFPYQVARWNTIGSDIYGIGPGSRALPDIKRLQEMEASLLMAIHKTVDPPINAPAHMRGKLNTMPGGLNFYRNPNEMIKDVYQVRFDIQGLMVAIERVEQRIKMNFYNDIFLTANRDPNATPYKAAEVAAREQEKMLRLGPVIERLQYEFFQPLVERLFNIMLRKEMFSPLDPKLAEIAGDYKIALVSPLAAAQRGVALQGLNSYISFIGQAAQFNPEILDNFDSDAAANIYADITGVPLTVTRTREAVQQMRQIRQQQQQQEKAKQEALIAAQVGGQAGVNAANTALTRAQAGQVLAETQQTAAQTGMI